MLFLFLLLLGRLRQKSLRLRRFTSDRDEIWQECCSCKWLNMHRLTVSDFRYDVIISKWRPWRHFIHTCTFRRLLKTNCCLPFPRAPSDTQCPRLGLWLTLRIAHHIKNFIYYLLLTYVVYRLTCRGLKVVKSFLGAVPIQFFRHCCCNTFSHNAQRHRQTDEQT